MKQLTIIIVFSIISCALWGCSLGKKEESVLTEPSTESEVIIKTTEKESSTETIETVFVGVVYDYTQGDLSFSAKSVSDDTTVIVDSSQMSSKVFAEMLYVNNQSTVTITYNGTFEENGKTFLSNIISMEVEIFDIYKAAGITDENIVRTLRNLAFHREVDFLDESTEISIEASVNKTENGLVIVWKLVNNSPDDIYYTPAYILSGIDTIGGDGKYHDFMDGYQFEEIAYICEAGSEVNDEILLPEEFQFLIDMRFAKIISKGEGSMIVYTDIPSQN